MVPLPIGNGFAVLGFGAPKPFTVVLELGVGVGIVAVDAAGLGMVLVAGPGTGPFTDPFGGVGAGNVASAIWKAAVGGMDGFMARAGWTSAALTLTACGLPLA